MAKIEGLAELNRVFMQRLQAARQAGLTRVQVGYGASYALFVHENMEMPHTNGQAKFLETPAREMRPQMAAIVQEVADRGGTLLEAEMAAGLALQQASQALCPVRTGYLQASAYTRVE